MADPELQWLSDALQGVVRWQVANPGREADVDAPSVPAAGYRVWGIFLKLLHAGRANGFGPNPIALADIEAYSRLHRDPLRPFELDIIAAMDRAYLEAVAEQRETRTTENQPSTRPLSRELFDALF